MNQDQIREQLLGQAHTGQLALFIGADLPREVTGLPSRADLACEMARRHRLDESLSLAEVAQRVSQAGNRFAFTNFIRIALDTTGKPPSAFHQHIVALVQTHRINTIITTAYDNLLEVVLQQAGIGFNRVVRGSDVNLIINPAWPTLIYLYGKADQADTLVVTDRDHSELLRDREREPLIDEVRQMFRRNTLLFYGYNLSGPDFKFLFDQIAENKFARLAYAVWPPKVPQADPQMWRDRGIVILEEDPLDILSGAITRSSAASPLAEPPSKIGTPDAANNLPVPNMKGPDLKKAKQNSGIALLLGTLAFITGVLGNLVAAWIQQDMLSNTFTLPRLSVILILTGVSIGTGIWLTHRPSFDKGHLTWVAVLIAVVIVFVVIASYSPPRPNTVQLCGSSAWTFILKRPGVPTEIRCNDEDIPIKSGDFLILDLGNAAGTPVPTAAISCKWKWNAGHVDIPDRCADVRYQSPSAGSADIVSVKISDHSAKTEEISLKITAH